MNDQVYTIKLSHGQMLYLADCLHFRQILEEHGGDLLNARTAALYRMQLLDTIARQETAAS